MTDAPKAPKRKGGKKPGTASDLTEAELKELMRKFPNRTREECIAYQRSQGVWPKEKP